MVDLSKYRESKASGLVSVAKFHDAYVVVTKKFDPATGQPLPQPEIEGVDIAKVDELIAGIETQLSTVNEFRADLLAAQELK